MTTPGYQTGSFNDPARTDWDGDAARPIAWSAWYPAAPGGAEAMELPGLFAQGPVARDAPLVPGLHPVILLSHGTGGAPEGQGWLAGRLAALGFIVLGPHHHGNTGGEPYRAEGFLCWWERATDLSLLLSELSLRGPFAGQLDLSRTHAVGFSLGAYAALALAGAISDMDRFEQWTIDAGRQGIGPPEFPDAADALPHLLDSSAPFRAAWDRQGQSFHDPRIRSVIAMAAPPPVRAFVPESVSAITLPVTLIAGGGDTEAPSAQCTDWLGRLNQGFRCHDLGPDIGHYTFLGEPAGEVPEPLAFLFADAPGVSRRAVHGQIFEIVLNALS